MILETRNRVQNLYEIACGDSSSSYIIYVLYVTHSIRLFRVYCCHYFIFPIPEKDKKKYKIIFKIWNKEMKFHHNSYIKSDLEYKLEI